MGQGFKPTDCPATRSDNLLRPRRLIIGMAVADRIGHGLLDILKDRILNHDIHIDIQSTHSEIQPASLTPDTHGSSF